jgi:uncharacterized repeat protein (TIGR03987 family)
MSLLLLTSTILITLALVFYSVGVWSERIARRLKRWHASLFWLGLVCDIVGTLLMAVMAGGFKASTHGISGLAAVLLMTLHAVWATVVLVQRSERALLHFHKFSLVVWTLWLFPYFTGMWLAMNP